MPGEGTIMQEFFGLFYNDLFLQIMGIVFSTMPFWLPLLLLFTAWNLWVRYVRIKQRVNTEYTLLEIRFPSDITRSPLAMETVFNVMYQTGEPSDWYEAYVQGKFRPEFSLEIASFEGEVHFFIRCRSKHKNIVEAQIYSQYPSVEVFEAEDYVNRFQYDPQTMNLFGLWQRLEKPDPYPIKTYVEFGLDKEQEAEYQIDPLNSIIEFMSSLKKNEYCFLQIIIRSHVPDKKVKGEKGKQDWQYEARKEVDKLLKRDAKTLASSEIPRFAEEERRVADAMLRNVSKQPFDTGIRMIYFAPEGDFRGDLRAGLPTVFRSFQSRTLNNFKPKFPTMFQWKYQDPFGWRAKAEKQELFEAYRWRSFFGPPYTYPKFVLSSEELATIYHFPGNVIQAPGLPRISSRRGDAPTNLPR